MINTKNKHINLLMFLAVVLISVAAITACGKKEEKLMVGKWEVKSYYHWCHDFTSDSLSYEVTYTLPDDIYIGYDSAEFKDDGTMRWHRNDLWMREGLFDDPYRDFNWLITEDTLIIYPEFVSEGDKYAIRELDDETLVIEEYLNNEHELYNQHHIEQIHRYTFSRCTK